MTMPTKRNKRKKAFIFKPKKNKLTPTRKAKILEEQEEK
jgi:hypothetical protein